jgi:acyl carrier protein
LINIKRDVFADFSVTVQRLFPDVNHVPRFGRTLRVRGSAAVGAGLLLASRSSNQLAIVFCLTGHFKTQRVQRLITRIPARAGLPAASTVLGVHKMLDRDAGLPRDRLLALVRQILAKNSITRPVSIDDQLTEAGLSSIDMVNLMLAIEAEFDLMIPASEITPTNFRSISTIEALILRIHSRITRR